MHCGGIGRRSRDEAHYAERMTIDKRLRLVMQGAKSLSVHSKTEERRESFMNAVAIMSIDSMGAYFSGKTVRKMLCYDPQVQPVVFNRLHPE